MTEQELKDRIVFLEADAKKAYDFRDEAKRQLREAEALALSAADKAAFEKWKTESATAEEERKRREGDFDKWKADEEAKHKAELEKETTATATARRRHLDTVTDNLFASALDLFGGSTARTILDPAMARKLLGEYVAVEDDDKDPRGYRVTVKGLDGKPIEPKKDAGNPFADAMGRLIEALPNRDRLIRGGGKTGSGSSGGDGGSATRADLSNLSAGDFKDPDIRDAVRKKHTQQGGVVFGRAFDKLAEQRAEK